MEITWPMIDPHDHCRDEKESYKATIASTHQLAREQGVTTICEMPNTNPIIDCRERVYERLKLVPEEYKKNHYIFVGLTTNKEQNAEAVWCEQNIPEVVGLKQYNCHSVGDLAIPESEDELGVWQNLTEFDYRGVVDHHLEEEHLMRPELWDPTNPLTHGQVRSDITEVASLAKQIYYAHSTGFRGHIHFCHVTLPYSVYLTRYAKTLGLSCSCAATPGHVMYDESKMAGASGLLWKINPPLRPRQDVEGLRRSLLDGQIDLIESDQAPHSPAEKLSPPYLSGYPQLELYHEFVSEFLPSLGLDEVRIKALTRDNILKIFTKIREEK